MVSTFTVSKQFEEPANGDYVDTWSTPVNANWTAIDACFGGTTPVNVVGLAGTYTFTSAQYRPFNIVFSGVLTANVTYQLPSGVGGFFTVLNNTTGAFNLIFASAGGGTTITLAQGFRTLLVSDGTNIQIAYTFPTFAGGSTSQIQFNSSGVLGGSASLTWDGTNLTTPRIKLTGATSGFVGFASPAIAPSIVWTLPSADGTSGQALVTNGSGTLSWATAGGGGGGGVTSFSAGTTGFTPATSATGVVTLAGILIPANGGTGFASYTTGDILYASSSTNLNRLAIGGSGTVLKGGTTPSWGQVALASAVSGTLPIGNGGTGATTGSSALAALGGVTTTGSGASGTWSISITGNAATATSLSGTVAVANGGTGATSAASAATNLGLGTGSSVQHGSLGVGTSASGTGGEIRATNNVTAFYSSDRQFKMNIKPIEGALDKVCAIGGKTFEWNKLYLDHHGGADGYFIRTEDFGVIAQDVEEVFPMAVRKRDDDTLAVDYQKLCVLAFEAIRELRAEVDLLREQVGMS